MSDIHAVPMRPSETEAPALESPRPSTSLGSHSRHDHNLEAAGAPSNLSSWLSNFATGPTSLASGKGIMLD